VPEWTISGSIEQEFVFGDGSRLAFNTDGAISLGPIRGFEKLPAQRQAGYFMADLHLQYELAAPKIAITAFVNNVTDKNVASFSPAHPGAPAVVTKALRPPRTYAVRLGYKF
jgi:iron complex outermembrane receptor protein